MAIRSHPGVSFVIAGGSGAAGLTVATQPAAAAAGKAR
jgi:hypothetical protein